MPHAGDGMYRSLLETLRETVPDLRVCGLTATPFRLDSGRLDEGEGKVFDEVVYDYGIAEGIHDGWLSPLSSKATQTTIDVRGVGRRAGEFILGELEAVADDQAIIEAACDEIVALGADRRAWLVFCCGISHATHVRDALRARGVSCETVFGETPQNERERMKENEVRPLRAVNIVGDVFHDDEDGLYEAAISAKELRRAGTQVFLIQLGEDPYTARKLQYLARVSGAAYFPFDPRTQERQFLEMWQAVSAFAAGGEQAVKITGGQAATLLLEHLKQEPMPIIEERDRVRVDLGIKE